MSWLINSQSIIDTLNTTSSNNRLVILILGQPTINQINSIINSIHLSNSLIIIANDQQPPIIPLTAKPAVRSFHSLDLVQSLQRAERIARIWRKHTTSGVVHLQHNDDGAYIHINNNNSKNLAKLLSHIPPVVPSQRPFDALFNFLSPNIPDTSILKQTILISTITHPFLCAAAPPTPLQPNPKRSFFSRTKPTQQLVTPEQQQQQKSHLVHVLPHSPLHYQTPPSSFSNGLGNIYQFSAINTRSRLIDSINAFLFNFSYPPLSTIERAASYLITASTLNAKIQYAPPSTNGNENKLFISDIILLGFLDPQSNASKTQRQIQKQKTTDPSSSSSPRTWIESENDIIVLGSGWSSGNPARLNKLSLAARPGLGLGTNPRTPRHRASLGRVSLSPTTAITTPFALRSVSTPNVVGTLAPPGTAVPGHHRQPSLPATLSSSLTAKELAIRRHSSMITDGSPTTPLEGQFVKQRKALPSWPAQSTDSDFSVVDDNKQMSLQKRKGVPSLHVIVPTPTMSQKSGTNFFLQDSEKEKEFLVIPPLSPRDDTTDSSADESPNNTTAATSPGIAEEEVKRPEPALVSDRRNEHGKPTPAWLKIKAGRRMSGFLSGGKSEAVMEDTGSTNRRWSFNPWSKTSQAWQKEREMDSWVIAPGV